MSFYDILLAQKLGGGGGSSVSVEPLSVSQNGTYSETGKAYSPVNVSVPTPSGSTNISANGTYDVTQYASASVAVPNSYTASDEGKVVSSGALVAQTSQTIDSNGTYDTTLKNEVVVNVSGGGGEISVDDIAMKRLSGVVSGSATSVGAYAFYGYNNITEASFPVCLAIAGYAFFNCRALTKVDFPNCSKMQGASIFNECSALVEANFPVCSNIQTNTFLRCSSLKSISFPSCTTIASRAFQLCSALAEVSFPLCTSIGESAFHACVHLLSVDLTGVSAVPVLSNYVFSSTPIGGYTASTGGVYGSVFVPASLYNSFLTATNWSSISARIVSVP